jgi:hypothetical protein
LDRKEVFKLSNIPTVKKTVISSLSYALTDPAIKDNKLILFTTSGVITGYPVEIDSDEYKGRPVTDTIISKLSQSIIETYDDTYHLEGPLPGNDGFFVLKDAVVVAGNHNYTHKEIVVFYDTVTAITIGNMD